MTFDELPPKTSAYIKKVCRKNIPFNYFFDNPIYSYNNLIEKISRFIFVYGGFVVLMKTLFFSNNFSELPLPKEIIEELFPYMFGQE